MTDEQKKDLEEAINVLRKMGYKALATKLMYLPVDCPQGCDCACSPGPDSN